MRVDGYLDERYEPAAPFVRAAVLSKGLTGRHLRSLAGEVWDSVSHRKFPCREVGVEVRYSVFQAC